ncbi:MAG: exopolysaccharide biosynthesis protein [Acidobacteriia bacterium]|nr:exopolysaccharide biosynthesis protein [Terriglobia bacterium]
MIDIHSHILPGLDDGSSAMEESIAMLRMAAAFGTTDIVATPHANMQFAFDPADVERRIAELQEAAGDVVRIHYGCDFHLTPENIDDALRAPGKYSINHRGYLLVEFSDGFIPKTTGEIFTAMRNAGICPIVTHPERNRLLQKKIEDLEAWVEQGCCLQVTAQSLLGLFGTHAKEFSHTLMERRLVHFLASDAHDLKHRTTDLKPAWQYVEEHYGGDMARRLFIDNPQSALDGIPLTRVRSRGRKKSWFSFFSQRSEASGRNAGAALASR